MTRKGEVPIEKVKIGDLVLTHKDRWMPVIQTMSRKDAPLVRLIGDGRKWLTMTPEHPIYASDGEFVDPTWIPAGQMMGKYWAIPERFDHCGPSMLIHYSQAGFDFAPVRAVEPAGTGEVFNIGVKDDESYVADGIVVLI